MTVDPNNEDTETKVLRQLVSKRDKDEELVKQQEEQKKMRDVIDELLAENKKVREQQSTTATNLPMPMIQQHLATTSGAGAASGAADTKEDSNPKRRSYHDYKDSYRSDGDGRGDNQTAGRHRKTQRSDGMTSGKEGNC